MQHSLAFQEPVSPQTVREIADAIVARIRPVCPRIVVEGSEKNSWIFFQGSAHEKMFRVHWELDQAQAYWTWDPFPRSTKDWGLSVTPDSLRFISKSLLFDAVAKEIGFDWEENWNANDPEQRRLLKAASLARFLLWGMPICSHSVSQNRFFTGLFLGTVRPSVPESIWKLACRNAGNGYQVNECVLKDALMEEAHYRKLYEIHPLLGRAWVPWVRGFVQETLGEEADVGRYAQQLRATLDLFGVTPAGFRTLHRLAECCPVLLNKVLYGIEQLVTYPYHRSVRQMVCLLNAAQGNKRPAPGVSLPALLSDLDWDDPNEDEPLASYEDRIAIERIRGWLKRSRTAQRLGLDSLLIRDWLHHAHERGTGAIHQGFSEVVRPYQRSDGQITPKGIAEALRWADRAQRRRHAERQQREVRSRKRREWTWDSLLESLTRYEIVLPDGSLWTFRELLSSADLWEEGEQMHHCVGTYDVRCARGESCIFAVTDPKGQRVSTLEIHLGWESPKRKRFTIEQHRGPGNAQVSAEAEQAALGLLQFLNEDERIAQARTRLAKRHADYLERIQRPDRTVKIDVDIAL